jgi:small-conductance mechanosensitive channel
VLAAAVGFGLAGGAIAQTTPDTSRPADAGSARGPAKAGAPTAPAKPSTGPAEAATSTGSLNDQLARLAKLEFELERALASAQLDVASARRRFESAQQRLDAASDPSDLLRDEVAARRLELESAQRVASLIQGRIDRRDDDEQRWRHLYALEDGSVSPEQLAEWLSQAETARDELSREATVKGDRLAEVRRDRQYTSDQIEGASPESTSTRWTRVRLRALEQLDRGYEADLANLDDSIALNKRLLERIRRAQEDLPISARLRGAMHYLREAWNYPLTGSEPEPITLGKVVGALVIFVIGWLLARTIARLLGARVFPGLKMEAGAAAAFESLAFYVLLLVVFLTALRMVQIPLTAFAVVGGALAIGVGFGSQTVVNNFISGIILLAERPIKRGDLVDVGGVFGNIEQIGLRSTRVRTGDNIHIIVPNASFLETNVVNWTLSDARVRLNIPVGVAYGSPTREVERLILEAVRDQPTVLREPAPVVLFVDFGDNALGFEARFWIEMRTVLARLRTESEIRFRIDELFREAGITIAFPQRDVHLDSLSPVEVRLVDESRTRVEPGDDDAVDREA